MLRGCESSDAFVGRLVSDEWCRCLEECMDSNSETASNLHGICTDLVAAKMLTEKSFEE
jgi:hypothetical protein